MLIVPHNLESKPYSLVKNMKSKATRKPKVNVYLQAHRLLASSWFGLSLKLQDNLDWNTSLP